MFRCSAIFFLFCLFCVFCVLCFVRLFKSVRPVSQDGHGRRPDQRRYQSRPGLHQQPQHLFAYRLPVRAAAPASPDISSGEGAALQIWPGRPGASHKDRYDAKTSRPVHGGAAEIQGLAGCLGPVRKTDHCFDNLRLGGLFGCGRGNKGGQVPCWVIQQAGQMMKQLRIKLRQIALQINHSVIFTGLIYVA